MTRIASFVIAVTALSLSACTNPYDPVQRGLGGGVLGAASGAAIGAAAGGGPGAALGAAIGGATGIFGGVASTPPPPPGTYYGYPAYGPPAYGYPGYEQPGYGIRATRETPLTPLLRAMDTQATQDSPLTPVHRAMDIQVIRGSPVTLRTPVLRAMGTRAVRCTLPIPVPDIPWLAIPAIALRRTGRLEPSTVSSLLAEFRPEFTPNPRRRS